MTCVCLFQMCCSTNYCIHTHSGLWSLLSPSPLWTTCPSAQWFRSASQIWVAFTGTACRNHFVSHWWLTMTFLLAFTIHFIEITFPSQVVEDVTPILYTSPEPKVGLTKCPGRTQTQSDPLQVYFCFLVIRSSSISTRRTRNSQLLNMPLFRSATGQRTFYYRTVSL